MEDAADRQDLVDTMARLNSEFERFEAKIDKQANFSNSSIRIDAGGAGLWIATTCCLIMLAVIFLGSVWVSYELNRHSAELTELRDKLDVSQAYLNILMQKKDIK